VVSLELVYTIFFIVSLLDLFSTVWWIQTGQAVESSVVLKPFAEAGMNWLILAKGGIFLIVPLLIFEALRRMGHGLLVRAYLRFMIAAYIFSYVYGICCINSSRG
jgi:hypothetical protein